MSRPRLPASAKPLPPMAHPWPIAIGKAFSLGLFMHLLAVPLFALGFTGVLAFHKFGDTAALLISLPFLIYAVLIETVTVWRGLYRTQYCRLREIWRDGKWVESAARTKLATPCQQRLLLSAATDAGFTFETQELLRRHRLCIWKVWTWMRESDRLKSQRRAAPFSLPKG